MTTRVDRKTARVALQRVSELLEQAIAEQSHPERVRALREAVDAISNARTIVNRQIRARYRAGESGRVRARQRATKGRARRNNRTMDTAAKRGQLWTDAEIRVLEQSDLTHMECAKRLGRTLRGVARKREALGILTDRSGNAPMRAPVGDAAHSGKQWTGPELEVVARADLSVREKAALLNRTENAISSAMRRLRTQPREDRLAGLSTDVRHREA